MVVVVRCIGMEVVTGLTWQTFLPWMRPRLRDSSGVFLVHRHALFRRLDHGRRNDGPLEWVKVICPGDNKSAGVLVYQDHKSNNSIKK